MGVFSLFHSIVVNASDDDVDDPIVAEVRDQLEAHERYNVLFAKQDELFMDEDDTKVVNLANYTLTYPNDWTICIAHVTGIAELQTVAKDYNNSSTINGYQRTRGTTVFPGILILSSYNITSFTFKALEDSTTIRYCVATACLAGDSRYDT